MKALLKFTVGLPLLLIGSVVLGMWILMDLVFLDDNDEFDKDFKKDHKEFLKKIWSI